MPSVKKRISTASDLKLKKDVDMEVDENENAEQPSTKIKQTRRFVAENSKFDKNQKPHVFKKVHDLSPVCVYFSKEGNFLISCSKDGSLGKYDLTNAKRCGILRRKKTDKSTHNYHVGAVTCCAISPNDKYIVTGGEDSLVKVWDFETLAHVKDFSAHRAAVTALAFRRDHDTLELFTAGEDRIVIAWSLDQMAIAGHMYGHEHAIAQMDALGRPRVLTCGGQDRTLRYFRVGDATHSVFNGPARCQSIDTVAMLDNDHFVSGAMDGSVCVWSTAFRHPTAVVPEAHGKRAVASGEPHWICSVAAFQYTDLVATGSSDGLLKLWRVAVNYKSLTLIDEFELHGFINDIRFSPDGSHLACAVGQEHRNGRWWRIRSVRNSVVVIKLNNAV